VSRDLMRYDKMVEDALRGVIREALARTAKSGLKGNHHFYITFRTQHPGVVLPDYLLARYPEEMTIVLEHQFWGLEVDDEKFEVTLSFSNKTERLTVPLAAVSAFADPSVKFGLQFQQETVPAEARPEIAPLKRADAGPSQAPAAAPQPAPAADAEKKPPPAGGAQVVALDQFRKK